nr:penicillin-binding transpeptidase domain-containing protein [Methylomarinum sp. Ch1-1]MDP4522276.1 penicillin-binding transpeptidase domain-containing protein [Methylomarinum sp. Ch1-1]
MKKLVTTLDGVLQQKLQGLLDQRMTILSEHHVDNAALLVVDHRRSEILAWVVAGAGNRQQPAAMIDGVTTLRQPGSALKPFLYAMALEKGWTAAAIIDDAPLAESVGYGLHEYQNYSRVFYGPVSLREALGNSLNIPALRTIQYVGVQRYLTRLRQLGFADLTRHPEVYGDGLALGNAEVSLLQLVQGFSTLANRGVSRPLQFEKNKAEAGKRLFSSAVASLVGNILSDPEARRLEFGSASVLNLPQQTAIKTGTSSDFRDSWAVGFNDRYTVGVWMGNLNNRPTDGLTGARGPGLLLRSVFSRVNQQRQTQPLYLSPQLIRKTVCRTTGQPVATHSACQSLREEYFLPTKQAASKAEKIQPLPIRFRQPSPGLHLAIDPRIPAARTTLRIYFTGHKSRRSRGMAYRWPSRCEDRRRSSLMDLAPRPAPGVGDDLASR